MYVLKWPSLHNLSYKGPLSFPVPLLPYFLRLLPYCPLASFPLVCPTSEKHPVETSAHQPKSLASFCLRKVKISQVQHLKFALFHKIKSAKQVKDQIKGRSCCSPSCRQVCLEEMSFSEAQLHAAGEFWPSSHGCWMQFWTLTGVPVFLLSKRFLLFTIEHAIPPLFKHDWLIYQSLSANAMCLLLRQTNKMKSHMKCKYGQEVWYPWYRNPAVWETAPKTGQPYATSQHAYF